jgi:hypothetical protein
LLRLIRQYLAGLPGNPRDRHKQWSKIERDARALSQSIGEVRAYPDSFEWIRLMLLDLAVDAQERAAAYELLPFAGERGFTEAGTGKLEKKRFEDEWLYRALSEFWIACGQKLSYAGGEGDPGRTVRFFSTVLAEIPGAPKLTDKGLIAVIARNRKRLGVGGSKQYPVE